MKKVFLILLLALLGINSVYSFDITDSSGNEKSYFSLNNPSILVKTSENLTNFTLTYTLSQEIIKEVNLVPCDINYCADVSLLNLIVEQNSSVPEFITFVVNINNQSKEVYLDSKLPEVQFLNSSLNSSLKILTLNFNYSDNSNKIAKIDLYEEINAQNVFLKEVSNLSSYDYVVSSIGNKIFVLKATDFAGNVKETRQIFAVEDIFNPQISSYIITKKDDKISFNFKIIDDHVQKYEISQNNLTLSEYVSGSSIEKTIVLPFNSGNVLFKVYDQNSNTESKTLNLDSTINYKQEAKYSNKKLIEITSNANECTLTKFDSKDVNSKFEKSSNKFSISIYADSVKNYEFEFYCDLNNYREYFKSELYFDNIAPTKPELNLTRTNDGNIEVSWTAGIDNQSGVIFNVFKDSKKIYSGSKSTYLDKEVEYPISYDYYVEAVDEAKNFAKSNEISEVPKKVKIKNEINLKKDQVINYSNFTLNLITDENTNISLFVKNGKTILFEKSLFNFTANSFSQDIMLEEGINEFQLTISDEFGNILKQTYFVTYQIPVVLNEVVQQEVISEKNSSLYKITIAENITDILVPEKAQEFATNVVSNLSSVFIAENKVEEEKVLSYTKVGLFFLFVIFAVLIWHYLFNEDKLRQGIKDLRYLKEKDTLNFFRSKDKNLNSSLENIRKEREQKQHIKQIEEEKNKKEVTKERNEYQSQKFSDISKRDRISDRMFSEDKRKINAIEKRPKPVEQIPVQKEQEEFIDETELMKRHQEKLEKKSSFFDWFKAEEKKNDELLNYLNKEKTKKSWNSKTDFVFKEPVKEVVKKEEPKDNLSLDKANSSEIKTTKVEEKIESKPEPVKNNQIDKKHMLDDYLGKAISKRRSFFAEREVNKDIFKRKSE